MGLTRREMLSEYCSVLYKPAPPRRAVRTEEPGHPSSGLFSLNAIARGRHLIVNGRVWGSRALRGSSSKVADGPGLQRTSQASHALHHGYSQLTAIGSLRGKMRGDWTRAYEKRHSRFAFSQGGEHRTGRWPTVKSYRSMTSSVAPVLHGRACFQPWRRQGFAPDDYGSIVWATPSGGAGQGVAESWAAGSTRRRMRVSWIE
ncbi:hypothetical protein PYCCODRAFT_667155 [Trametes coccinea BRFM310]|uniref:Uncharacterized protein n=1 Tax=Trametes coccinea (strain BRFM310) TaxID=1353009 RepID=A0A1Y2IIX4_TRAC3|nr:hypothetical protein PYCCODRAFT_667155 [Trametes coccinea BRFM310]